MAKLRTYRGYTYKVSHTRYGWFAVSDEVSAGTSLEHTLTDVSWQDCVRKFEELIDLREGLLDVVKSAQ